MSLVHSLVSSLSRSLSSSLIDDGDQAYTPNTVRFDGTNDYMTAATGIGVTNSTFCVFRALLYFHSVTGVQYVFTTTNNRLAIFLNGATPFAIFSNSSGSPVAAGTSAVNLTINTWYNFLVTVDSSSISPDPHIRGVVQALGSPTVQTMFNSSIISSTPIDYQDVSFAVGATTAGASRANMSIADLYIAQSQQNALNTSFQQKFITAGGDPVNLGPTGLLPTGSAPLIYLPNAFGTFNENESTAGLQGDFTVTGALSQGEPIP